MALREFKPSRTTVFVMLLVLSGASLFLPPGATDPIKHVGQLLVPAQDLARTAAHSAAGSLKNTDGTDGTKRSNTNANDPADGRRARELASASALIVQLQMEIDRLRALRDHQLPPSIPLLDARVVARDAAAWRDAALVARGSERGVHRRDWVASRLFVDRGAISDVKAGQAVLAGESLIGRIEQVSPYMARVQLLTDVDAPRVEVRIAASEAGPGAGRLIDYTCSLRGRGEGRMMIENVPERYVDTASEVETAKQRRIRVGDYVVTAPGYGGLPVPMVVGRIETITENPRKRLVYQIIVRPIADLESLRDVFIIPLTPTDAVPIP